MINVNTYQYLLVFFTMAFSAFLATPIFRMLARKARILDYPGGRKLQESPVAYLGGLAIATPITIGSIFFMFSNLENGLKFQVFFGLVLPSLMIMIIGLLDDIYQLLPLPRFIAQTTVGIITSVFLNLTENGISLFTNPWFNGLITTFWVVTIINAINFLDNMDGLATIISIISGSAIFILSYANGQFLVAILSLAISASCLGFLFWNRNPASIYLGDAGALYLGFLLAAISIRVDVNSHPEYLRVLVPVLIFAIPVIDITQVVITRIQKQKSPFNGGRDHLSHLLMNYGFSQNVVLIILTFTSCIFSGIGIFLALGFL